MENQTPTWWLRCQVPYREFTFIYVFSIADTSSRARALRFSSVRVIDGLCARRDHETHTLTCWSRKEGVSLPGSTLSSPRVKAGVENFQGTCRKLLQSPFIPHEYVVANSLGHANSVRLTRDCSFALDVWSFGSAAAASIVLPLMCCPLVHSVQGRPFWRLCASFSKNP